MCSHSSPSRRSVSRPPPPAARPPLANRGFEDDGTGVAEPAGWESRGTIDADFTEAGGHSGGFRLDPLESERLRGRHPADAARDLRDGWYTLRACVKRSTGRNDSYVALRCGDDRERVHVPVAWPDQWLQVVVSGRGATRIGARSSSTPMPTAANGRTSTTSSSSAARATLSVLGADVSSLKKSEDKGGRLSTTTGHGPLVTRDAATPYGSWRITGSTTSACASGWTPRTGTTTRPSCWRWPGGRRPWVSRCWSICTTPTPGRIPATRAKPAAWASYTVEQLRAGRLRPHLRRLPEPDGTRDAART